MKYFVIIFIALLCVANTQIMLDGNRSSYWEQGDVTAPAAPTSIVFDTLGVDSTKMTITGWPDESGTNNWLAFKTSSMTVSGDTATADTLFYSADSITGSKHWEHGITANATVYYMIVQNDSLVNERVTTGNLALDNWLDSAPTIATFDTMGANDDTLQLSAITWDAHTTGFWIGLDDTLNTGVGDTSNCDSLWYYAASDSNSAFRLAHGIVNVEDGSWEYILIVATDGTNLAAVYDSTQIYDEGILATGSFTFAYDSINVGISTVNFGGATNDDIAGWSITGKTETSEELVTLNSGSDTSGVDPDTSSLTSLSFSGQDTLMLEFKYWDDGVNIITLYDSVFNDSSLTDTLIATVGRDSISAIKFALSNNNVFANLIDSSIVLDVSDLDTTNVLGDSLIYFLPGELSGFFTGDSFHAWTKLKVNNDWQADWGDSARFVTTVAGDATSPDSVDVFTLIGDAAGKDTLRTIIQGFNNPASKDSFYTFYKIGSAASDLTDSTAILITQWKAVADSATYDTMAYAIDWADDYTVYGYLVQKDSLDNTQTVATANHMFATVDSTAGASCTTENDAVFFNHVGDASYDGIVIRESNSNVLYVQIELGASSYTVTEYVIHVADIGETGSLQAALYLDDADEVGAIIANTTVTVGNADITNSPTYEDQVFTLSVPKTGITGTVWVGFDAIGEDAYFITHYSSSAGLRVLYEASTYADNFTGPVSVYGCEE